MGATTCVIGFKPPDEKFKKMLEAYRACELAGIKIPDEVRKFFNDEPPDPTGVKVELRNYGAPKGSEYARGVKPWEGDCAEGYEIDVRQLDPDIKIVRVYTSY
jgi:hypothetical protein